LERIIYSFGKKDFVFSFKNNCFKPLCLVVATWLLVKGLIRDWIWFSVLVIVLFGIVGLKVISKWRDIDHE